MTQAFIAGVKLGLKESVDDSDFINDSQNEKTSQNIEQNYKKTIEVKQTQQEKGE